MENRIKYISFYLLLYSTLSFYFIQAPALYSQSWSNSGPYGAIITELIADPIDTNIIYEGRTGRVSIKVVTGEGSGKKLMRVSQ